MTTNPFDCRAVFHGGYKYSNTAENFFSMFRRGVIGTYHNMSEAHLGRYTGEFDFRYNTRKLTDSESAVVPFKQSKARASPIGGLTNSQPDFYKVPRQIRTPCKRWTD